MKDAIISGIVTVATSIVGLAILAVLVSGRAKTSSVISAGGKSFAGAIAAAVSPVTSGGGNGSSYPTAFNAGVPDINNY